MIVIIDVFDRCYGMPCWLDHVAAVLPLAVIVGLVLESH